MMKKLCSVIYDEGKQEFCHRNATTFALEDGVCNFYCVEHGRERGAQDLDPTVAARAEARVLAQHGASPDVAIEPAAATELYVEAFVAGALFAATRCGMAG